MSAAVTEFARAAEQNGGLLDRTLVAAFLENFPDNVYFKDRRSNFLAVSESVVRTFGCTDASEVIGKSDFDFFSEEHARPAFEDEQRIMLTGRPILGKVEREVWPDGRITWAVSNKLPLRNRGGEIIGTFGQSKNVTESKRLESALEKAQADLVEASRQAGMAEVATGVLHNVGNVLNSLNVSASLIAAALRQSRVGMLGKLSVLLQEHRDDLGPFFTSDPKGRRVLELVASLAHSLAEDQERLLGEITSLQENVDHIKDIVTMQQSYATMVGILEPLSSDALMADAIRMNSAAFSRHDVRVVRDFHPAPPVLAERGKVLQILINFIRNAKYACDEQPCGAGKVVTFGLAPAPDGRYVRLSVTDNGVGIAPENLTRIFNHGFTTKATGHGFGLHASANAAKEMKGTITVHSAGLGQGATFTLELPVAPAAILATQLCAGAKAG
ncbi:MAG: ATP-binding protein [Verrucomicrobiota bacterium]